MLAKRRSAKEVEELKLWLDDIRGAPEGWVWVATVEEAVSLVASGEVVEASFEHDVGNGKPEGSTL